MGVSSTVTINAKTYAIYGTTQGCADYWNSELGDEADAWAAASPTQQAKAQVKATRMLDRQPWQGLPVATPIPDVQVQWPRSGVYDRDQAPVDATTIPDRLVEGSYALAGALLGDPTVADTNTSGSNVASVGAGPAQVSFFRPTLGQTGRFATQVQELVGEYLAGSVSTADGVGSASGVVDSTGAAFGSSFDDGDGYDLNRSI